MPEDNDFAQEIGNMMKDTIGELKPRVEGAKSRMESVANAITGAELPSMPPDPRVEIPTPHHQKAESLRQESIMNAATPGTKPDIVPKFSSTKSTS
jgi:hypothetical protein